MAYDAMGNYTGFDEVGEPVNPYDYDEEERKKKELRTQLETAQKQQEELASQVSQKQEITTMADGSQVEKTTKKMPAAGPVNPADYNASIAQQESGNNPNIGYHDRSKGTAAGMYGMTDAGYADARKLDPNLPADRLQSTPEQQTAAQNAYTQQNTKYLQNYGIEPTQNNLSAAHFLGAKGLSDYLKTGYISEAAAKANGGMENVKRIVNQRLGGQSAAASGGATAPNVPQARPGPGVAVATGQGVQGTMSLAPGEEGGMPTQKPPLQPISPEQAQQQMQPPVEGGNAGGGIKMPGMGQPPTPGEDGSKSFIDRYQNDQNDPQALMKLSADNSTPEWMRERSRNRAADIITQQREMKNAQAKLETATPTELAKYMREKSTGGSWLKAIFYASIGAKTLAQAEGAKLGIGTEKIVTDANGKSHIVKVAANGTPLEGYSSETGKKLTAEELVAALGQGTNKREVSTSAEMLQDKDGNVYRSQSDKNGNLITKNIATNKEYTGDPTKLTRMRDVAGAESDERKQGFKRENMTTEQTNRLAVLQTQLGNDLTKAKAKDRLSIFSDTNKALVAEGLPTLTMAQMGLAQDGSLTSEKAAPPQAAATQTAAPAAAATPTGNVAAPVAPEGGAVAAPVSPEAAARPPTLNEINKRKEEEKSARETKEAAAKKIATEAAEAVSQSPQTVVNMNKIDKAVKHLEKGTTNFGAAGGGLRKGEFSGSAAQKVGRFFDTEDARNTQDVMEAINGVVLERANLGKMTDKDLEFYTAGKPTIDDSPERVKEWLDTAKTDLKNKLEFNKQQAASGGRKGPMEQTPAPVAPPPSIPGGTSKIIGGVTYVYDGKGWKKK